MYPRGVFYSNIIVNKLIDNETSCSGYGLTFSGGVDSTYSLISNLEKKPTLIMYLGADINLDAKKDIKDVKDRYLDFSRKLGLELHFIESYGLQNIDEDRVSHAFHNVLGGTFWEYLMHGLFNASNTAPFSVGRFRTLLMASSDPEPGLSRKYGSSPEVDGLIKWADKDVRQDSVILRQKKAAELCKSSLRGHLNLRVCTHQISENCCSCEKCYRTMLSLLVSGNDPNEYGFRVNRQTFENMKRFLTMVKIRRSSIADTYVPIQSEMIRQKRKPDVDGYTEFYEWFENLSLEDITDSGVLIRELYYSVPFPISEPLYKLAKKMKLDIIKQALK